jgi:hypothetical protein
VIKVFISYSHENETERNVLEKHLAVLKRDGHIDTWYDRRILAGAGLHGEIDKNLLESTLVLLLVSPDFLASDYCCSIEMQTALTRRQQGITWVIPIIIDHCDWLHTPLKELRACPEDGKPVSDYPNPNKAFNEITNDIRRVIEEIKQKQATDNINTVLTNSKVSEKYEIPVVIDNMRSSNLRIKKEFTDFDRDAFKKEAFQYMSKYFHNSLGELKQRNPDINYIYEPETNRFCATIYRSGKEIASCAIVNINDGRFSDGISYSGNKDTSGINALLSVETDGYSLLLKALMNPYICNNEDRFSKKGAAELFWKLFISRLQQ